MVKQNEQIGMEFGYLLRLNDHQRASVLSPNQMDGIIFD
jgi:hypothetical protein